MFVEPSNPLPTFKLLTIISWLFLLSSAPFLLLLVPNLPAPWLTAFWLCPQLIWSAFMFVGAKFSLRTNVFNSSSIIFSVVAGYLIYNLARHVYVSSLVDRGGWGEALDIAIFMFFYCPILLVLFLLIWATSRWLGLSALFRTKVPLSHP